MVERANRNTDSVRCISPCSHNHQVPPTAMLTIARVTASMVPGVVLLPIGLLIVGWTARPNIHWIVPDIAIALVGAGMVLNFQAIQTYFIDAFPLYAASGEYGPLTRCP